MRERKREGENNHVEDNSPKIKSRKPLPALISDMYESTIIDRPNSEIANTLNAAYESSAFW